jgi:hypothetical protein
MMNAITDKAGSSAPRHDASMERQALFVLGSGLLDFIGAQSGTSHG